MAEEERYDKPWSFTSETPHKKTEPKDAIVKTKTGAPKDAPPEDEKKPHADHKEEPKAEAKQEQKPTSTSSGKTPGGLTMLAVALLGAGVVFVASALDNSSIIDTFHKIISGEKIDWTGSVNTLSSTDQGTIKKNAGGIPPDANGNCPSGYSMMGGVCMPNSVLGQI